MTHEKQMLGLQKRLHAIRGKYPEVAKRSGLSISLIRGFAVSKDPNMLAKNLDKIAKAVSYIEKAQCK